MGRKKICKSRKEMQEKINQYFQSCDGKLLVDEAGKPILDKYGNILYQDRCPPTVTGLALALGFKTRKTLLEYQAQDEFKDIIDEAKTRCEAYAEKRLYDKEGVNGAKFSLANNFRGWDGKSDPLEEVLKKLDSIIGGIDDTANG